MYTVKDIVKVARELAPAFMAEDYDNVGLLAGDPEAEVKKILCVLDVTLPILREAKNREVDFIISHHPVIFSGVKRLLWNEPEGKLLGKLMKEGISVMAAHTNLDSAPGGLNDYFAEKLELQEVRPLQTAGSLYTIGVYVPESHVEAVRSALFAAGAGRLGRYDRCSFSMEGEGGFRPLAGARPFAGEVGSQLMGKEVKLEVMVPDYLVDQAVRAVRKSHPYEEPAFQVLRNQIGGRYGLGRVGSLKERVSLEAFCGRLKELLHAPVVKVAGKLSKTVQTVAVCTGSGSDLYDLAEKQGADVYVTAEVKHHIAVRAAQSDTAVIDAGHYETEVMAKELFARHLQNRLNGLQYTVDILFADAERPPFTCV